MVFVGWRKNQTMVLSQKCFEWARLLVATLAAPSPYYSLIEAASAVELSAVQVIVDRPLLEAMVCGLLRPRSSLALFVKMADPGIQQEARVCDQKQLE